MKLILNHELDATVNRRLTVSLVGQHYEKANWTLLEKVIHIGQHYLAGLGLTVFEKRGIRVGSSFSKT